MDAWLILIIVLPVIFAIIGAIANSSKTNSFVALGDISGKPLSEIIAAVGNPNSISSHPQGSLYQWLGVNGGSSYHYAILVDHEQKAVCYTHQHVS
jgi:hypothetical protein